MQPFRRPPFRGTVVDPQGLTQIYSFSGYRSVGAAASLTEVGSTSSVRSNPWPPPKNAPKPQNPYSYQRTLTEFKWGRIGRFDEEYGRWGGKIGYVSGSISGSVKPWPSIFAGDDLLKARRKVLDQLQDQSVNLAQAFAERKQTVQMLAKTVNRLVSAALAIRRGDLKHAGVLFGQRYGTGSVKRTKDEVLSLGRSKDRTNRFGRKTYTFTDATRPDLSQNLSNHWLEYSYGWRPLLNDIYGSCELLANTFYKNKPSRVIGAAKSSIKVPPYIVVGDGNATEIGQGSLESKARIVVDYAVSNDFAHLMSQTGISNPANLAWELLPYSFVVDWFVPVGAYLKRLDATLGFSFVGGTESWSTESLVDTRIQPAAGATPGTEASGGRTYLRQVKSRTILTQFPRDSFPSPKNPFGVDHVLSGISLLTQTFRR